MNDSRPLSHLLNDLRCIHLPKSAPEVVETIAEELLESVAQSAKLSRGGAVPRKTGTLALSVGKPPRLLPGRRRKLPTRWVSFGIDERGRCSLSASHSVYLYSFFRWLLDRDPLLRDCRTLFRAPAFAEQRPVWDLYFNQAARSIRGLDREAYVRQMARFGFTHLEVNGLASPEGLEEGVPGEVYQRFYTYLPALDQFVDSFLNRGTYPRRYLRANLERLKGDCALAKRFGLIPAITCFEPRSVPESLLEKYPELRGARVDHPFRSFKPRFNLAVAHPVVRRHYRELIQNLLREVPELGHLSVWSNDSGAGFEFTRTLYVGANGSAYLVREWSDPDVFARSAARNVTEFLRLLQTSAAEINPDFRVATRLEPFGPEREAVLEGMGDGLDVEVASLFDRGWESPYGHPRFSDCSIAPFTLYNNGFDSREKKEIAKLSRRGCRTDVMYAHGPVNNFEPLLSVPAPWLTHEKLKAMRAGGAEYLAHFGGVAPPSAVRWNINEEVFRRFQFDETAEVDRVVAELAEEWVGPRAASRLVRVWRDTDRAIRAFHPNPLYFSWNVWYRILTRPLVSDIEAIPERERRYYERHVLTTHHNPTRFDLRRDVLFDLMTPQVAARAVKRIDRGALPLLERAIGRLESAAEEGEVFSDQLDRLRALRCWFVTNRNVCAWIADVHGYLDSDDRRVRAACRARLREMIESEIANAKALLDLWRESETVFMAIAEVGETTFIHGRRFGAQLRNKIRLMEEYRDLPPRIDPEVMWRVARLPSPAGEGS
jgi:hypothetical protein